MNTRIGSPRGLSRNAALLMGWGMVVLCLCLGAYEFLNPGGLSAYGRNMSLFSWATDTFGPRGIVWIHVFFAVIATLFSLAIQLSKDGKNAEEKSLRSGVSR